MVCEPWIVTMPKKNPSIEFIQAFRGIAALIVVLWHGSRFVAPYGSWIGEALFGQGSNMGVDLFFLISGFVMVITSKPGQVREFSVRRLTRIVPVYFVMTFAYVFLLQGGLRYFEDYKTLILLGHSLTFIPESGGMPPTFAFPTLVVGWTLNYEMYFYLIFGISLLFGRLRWAFLFAYFALTLIAIPAAFSTFSMSPESSHSFGVAYLDLITNTKRPRY
jgi:exopolysaccharide production protein ExoZ